MPQRLRIALIGPGWIGRRHLEILAAQPDVELVAVVGGRPGTAAAAAALHGGRPYDDVPAMLAAERPDAAWICVPPDMHGGLELALLERGVHLFVEKPLAADTETPERVAEAIRGSGLVAAVGYHWRGLDTLPAVRAALAGRTLRLVSAAWHDAMPTTPWWRDARRSGGQVVEQATHLVDLARHLVGEAVVLGAATVQSDRTDDVARTVPDATAALLRFDSGAIGVVEASCILGGPAVHQLRLVADMLAVAITPGGVRFEGQGDREAARSLATGSDPILAEDRAFIDAVRASDPARVLCGYDDALATHRLTCAIRSAADGGGEPG